MKTTILGGLLFLVPVAFLAIVVGKAFQLSLLIAKPIDRIIPVDHLIGVAFVNIIAVLVIIGLCYLAGLAAQRGWMSRRLEALDGMLIDALPSYAVAKGMIGSVANDGQSDKVLQPVLVRFDDYDQIGFEIERNTERAVVFLPGAPSTWSGATILVDPARLTPMQIPTHQAVKLMRVLGRGTLKLRTKADG